MIFHETRLLADDSFEIPYLIFFRNLGKMLQNVSSAAVVIGALRVNVFLQVSTTLVQRIICHMQSRQSRQLHSIPLSVDQDESMVSKSNQPACASSSILMFGVSVCMISIAHTTLSTQLSTKFQLLIKTKIPTNKDVSCFKSLR